MGHPQTDAARALLDQISDCLDLNGLPVPAHQGVVWCTECILPECCDHLVAVMDPNVSGDGCIPDTWSVPILFGVCYAPCSGTSKPSVWLAAQGALADRLENVLEVILGCGACDGCVEPVSVEKFCDGGCAGFRITFELPVGGLPALPEPDPGGGG